MIAKNSVEKLGYEQFRDVLEASLQVPYRLFVLVDDSTSDATRRAVRRFAEEHNVELIVERSGAERPTRATARQRAIDVFLERTVDPWLMFLDDDVILIGGWWGEAVRHMQEPRVGLIWGVDYTLRWRSRLAYLEARGAGLKDYLIQQFKIRGGLHDTLLRRRAIEGVRLPHWLHVYEDAWIKRYVECRGFEWRIVETGALHLRSSAAGYTDEDLETAARADALLRLHEPSLLWLLKAVASAPLRVKHQGLGGWWRTVRYRCLVLKHSRGRRADPCSAVL